MSDWKKYYQEHLTTAAEAVKHIKSGNRVVIGHACGEPAHLVNAMVDNAAAYKNVEIVHMVAMGGGKYCQPEYAETFGTMRCLSVEAHARQLLQDVRIIRRASFLKFPGYSEQPYRSMWQW